MKTKIKNISASQLRDADIMLNEIWQVLGKYKHLKGLKIFDKSTSHIHKQLSKVERELIRRETLN